MTHAIKQDSHTGNSTAKIQRPEQMKVHPADAGLVIENFAQSVSFGRKTNSASGSMNFLINQGQATRSTFTCSRVIQRIATKSIPPRHATQVRL